MQERGERRTFWLPNELDEIVEETRTKIGMSKSGFYRYAVVRLLQELSVLTENATREES